MVRPFGRRFNRTWAPIRIVMAFGLLMPLTVGLNSSQYIVLYAAKYGSAFATNGWRVFSDTLSTSYLGDIDSLIVAPTMPEIGAFTQFMFLAKTCEYAYEEYYATEHKRKTGVTLTAAQKKNIIDAYVLLEQSSSPNTVTLLSNGFHLMATGVDDLLSNFANPKVNIIQVVYGRKSEADYPKERGFVKPVCGKSDNDAFRCENTTIWYVSSSIPCR